jgi:starch phosphorylase
MAKLIVKLVNEVARVVNSQTDISRYLKLAFLPDYRVSMMEVICPGTELSEQISTAGNEASGTGNMKLMMNGALTIGTLDGANVEILDAVGEQNFFVFGLSAQEVAELCHSYQPQKIVDQDPDLAAVIDLLRSGHFNQDEPGIFDPIIDSILSPGDPWMIAADFRTYVQAQQLAAETYLDQARWTRMSILNTAASGYFSTDRTMAQYNSEIWHLDPVNPDSVSDGGNQP